MPHSSAEPPPLLLPQGGVVNTCSYLTQHQLLPQVPELLDAHGARRIKLITG